MFTITHIQIIFGLLFSTKFYFSNHSPLILRAVFLGFVFIHIIYVGISFWSIFGSNCVNVHSLMIWVLYKMFYFCSILNILALVKL